MLTAAVGPARMFPRPLRAPLGDATWTEIADAEIVSGPSILETLVFSKIKVPVGATDARIGEIAEDWLRQVYRIRVDFGFPFGQLSLGL
jgi:hypothetical protein